MKRARRRLQCARDVVVRESLLRDYRRLQRNSYFADVKKAKKDAWEKFITDRRKKEMIVSSMKFEDGYEHDPNRLASKLL